VSGGVGDLFHGAKVDVESGSVVPEGASGDDFGPLFGEVVELLQFVGRELVRCHPEPPT
jgi:hypothetical protein